MLRTLLPASTILCAILLPLAGHAEQLDELISPNLELPSRCFRTARERMR